MSTLTERRRLLRDTIAFHGPDHFEMDFFARIRRPWGEYERLKYRQAVKLTPAELDQPETVVCVITRAALLIGCPDDDSVAREHFDLPPIMYVSAWDEIEVDGWNMGAAYAAALEAAEACRPGSRGTPAVKRYHQWSTVLELLDRLTAADAVPSPVPVMVAA